MCRKMTCLAFGAMWGRPGVPGPSAAAVAGLLRSRRAARAIAPMPVPVFLKSSRRVNATGEWPIDESRPGVSFEEFVRDLGLEDAAQVAGLL